MEIRKGDNVVIIAGKDKGKKGKVLETSPKANKLVVENVNIVTKHKKPKSAQDKGGIVKQTNPIQRSNAMIICAACDKATRIAHKEIDGKKVRICKHCGASLDKEFVKSVKKDTKKTEQKVENKEVKTQEKSVKTAVSKPRTTKTAEPKVAKKASTVRSTTAKQQKIGSKGQ